MIDAWRLAFDLHRNVVRQVEHWFVTKLRLIEVQEKHTTTVTAFASATLSAVAISIVVIKELPTLEDSEVE